MKNVFWRVCLCWVLLLMMGLGVSFYALFYSHRLPGVTVQWWLSKQYPDVTLEDFDYKQRSLVFLKEVLFDKIKFSLRRGNIFYSGELGQFQCQSNRHLWKKEKRLTVLMKEGNLKIVGVEKTFELKGINLNVEFRTLNNKVVDFKGDLIVRELSQGKNVLRNLSSNLQGTARKMTFTDVEAEGYGGRFKGEVVFNDLSQQQYEARFDFDDLDFNQLRQLNDLAFSQMEGTTDGSINVLGQGSTLKDVELNLNLAKGSLVKAYFWAIAAQSGLKTVQLQQLEQSIKKDAYEPVEKGIVQLKSQGKDRLEVNLNLMSQKLSVNENVTVDVRFDVPIEQWLSKIDMVLIKTIEQLKDYLLQPVL